jgi:AcrR family transcriptional regulator
VSTGEAAQTRLTPRGAATRDRIVAAAADLMYVRGVHATTLDDIRAATGVSKSQLYRHFPDKDALVHAVIESRGQEVLQRETQRLERLSSFSGLVRWRNALIGVNSLQNGAYGCALGSMASELADTDERARRSLARLFTEWETLLADGLRRPGQGKADRSRKGLRSGLPELDPVALRVDDPAESAHALEVLHLGRDLGPVTAQLGQHGVQVADPEVEHGLLGGRAEVVGVGRERRERGDARLRMPDAVLVGVEAEGLAVPGPEGFRVFGSEEVPADAGHSFHDAQPFSTA